MKHEDQNDQSLILPIGYTIVTVIFAIVTLFMPHTVKKFNQLLQGFGAETTFPADALTILAPYWFIPTIIALFICIDVWRIKEHRLVFKKQLTYLLIIFSIVLFLIIPVFILAYSFVPIFHLAKLDYFFLL